MIRVTRHLRRHLRRQVSTLQYSDLLWLAAKWWTADRAGQRLIETESASGLESRA